MSLKCDGLFGWVVASSGSISHSLCAVGGWSWNWVGFLLVHGRGREIGFGCFSSHLLFLVGRKIERNRFLYPVGRGLEVTINDGCTLSGQQGTSSVNLKKLVYAPVSELLLTVADALLLVVGTDPEVLTTGCKQILSQLLLFFFFPFPGGVQWSLLLICFLSHLQLELLLVVTSSCCWSSCLLPRSGVELNSCCLRCGRSVGRQAWSSGPGESCSFGGGRTSISMFKMFEGRRTEEMFVNTAQKLKGKRKLHI